MCTSDKTNVLHARVASKKKKKEEKQITEFCFSVSAGSVGDSDGQRRRRMPCPQMNLCSFVGIQVSLFDIFQNFLPFYFVSQHRLPSYNLISTNTIPIKSRNVAWSVDRILR